MRGLMEELPSGLAETEVSVIFLLWFLVRISNYLAEIVTSLFEKVLLELQLTMFCQGLERTLP